MFNLIVSLITSTLISGGDYMYWLENDIRNYAGTYVHSEFSGSKVNNEVTIDILFENDLPKINYVVNRKTQTCVDARIKGNKLLCKTESMKLRGTFAFRFPDEKAKGKVERGLLIGSTFYVKLEE